MCEVSVTINFHQRDSWRNHVGYSVIYDMCRLPRVFAILCVCVCVRACVRVCVRNCSYYIVRGYNLIVVIIMKGDFKFVRQ